MFADRLVSFVLLAGDSLEVAHVGRADRRADDLQLLNHGGLRVLLVVLNEDQDALHVLEKGSGVLVSMSDGDQL